MRIFPPFEFRRVSPTNNTSSRIMEAALEVSVALPTVTLPAKRT